ncbi:MAG TPA: hypothetical protein VHH15_07815 [Actinophytocola sp.]|nr:hypothetical protein [Actinophytocola sp.]
MKDPDHSQAGDGVLNSADGSVSVLSAAPPQDDGRCNDPNDRDEFRCRPFTPAAGPMSRSRRTTIVPVRHHALVPLMIFDLIGLVVGLGVVLGIMILLERDRHI